MKRTVYLFAFLQDGVPPGPGTVTGLNVGLCPGWVEVEWDAGESYNYRMGDDNAYDLALSDKP